MKKKLIDVNIFCLAEADSSLQAGNCVEAYTVILEAGEKTGDGLWAEKAEYLKENIVVVKKIYNGHDSWQGFGSFRAGGRA